jgi:hypothetical protein
LHPLLPPHADPIYLKPQSVGDIKVGGYSMCKGFPCKIRDYSTAKTGKHGALELARGAAAAASAPWLRPCGAQRAPLAGAAPLPRRRPPPRPALPRPCTAASTSSTVDFSAS